MNQAASVPPAGQVLNDIRGLFVFKSGSLLMAGLCASDQPQQAYG